LLKTRPDLVAIEFAETHDGLSGFCFSSYDKASHAVINYLGHRAATEGDDRCAARHGFLPQRFLTFQPFGDVSNSQFRLVAWSPLNSGLRPAGSP
jgi:hypothetical protein